MIYNNVSNDFRGSEEEVLCVFPFKYQDLMFYGCSDLTEVGHWLEIIIRYNHSL